jgi:two-component system chemotaxis response regulator CheB
MDGFTFLRILQKTRATPIIVITSDARPEAAIMALELGARDFVVKPSRPGEMKQLGTQLLTRVRALAGARDHDPPVWSTDGDVPVPTDVGVVVIGASTGGPRALRDIVGRLRGPPRVPVLIVQHMPPRFTEAFAERLRKTSGLDVREAIDGELARPGQIRVAPGGRHLSVVGVEHASGAVRLALSAPGASDRWVPGVDVLFRSAASALGRRVLGVVLTGMGKDGGEGAKALADVGAPLWTESPLTAAIDGMPLAAAQAHGHAHALALDHLAVLLGRLLDGEPGV